MAKKSDLPLEAYILELGDKVISENLITRLDKHILKRDEDLVNIGQDSAMFLLINHFAARGDKRLLDLLSDNTVNENVKNSALVSYYEALGEWDQVVKLLWSEKDRYSDRALLKRALAETNQIDKLIKLQIGELVHSHDIKVDLIKLEHQLKEFNKLDQLPSIIESLIANPNLGLDQRIWLLMEQKRYKEVAKLLIQSIDLPKDPMSRIYIPSLLNYTVRQLELVDPETSIDVWKAMFKREAEKVNSMTIYVNFQEQGDALMRLGADKFVKDKASSIIKKYPTRKKLVSICESWLI
jgi:tetratricopeptide (TPR) repeat protein